MEGIIVNVAYVVICGIIVNVGIIIGQSNRTKIERNRSKCNTVGIFLGQGNRTKILLLEGIVVNVALGKFY